MRLVGAAQIAVAAFFLIGGVFFFMPQVVRALGKIDRAWQFLIILLFFSLLAPYWRQLRAGTMLALGRTSRREKLLGLGLRLAKDPTANPLSTLRAIAEGLTEGFGGPRDPSHVQLPDLLQAFENAASSAPPEATDLIQATRELFYLDLWLRYAFQSERDDSFTESTAIAVRRLARDTEQLLDLGAQLSRHECRHEEMPDYLRFLARHSEPSAPLLARALNEITLNEEFYREVSEADKALFKSVLSNRSDDVERCLEQGANVNARRKYGFTPLHEAAKKGHLALVELLIRHGADRHAVSDQGVTVDTIATTGRQPEVTLLLAQLDKGRQALREVGSADSPNDLSQTEAKTAEHDAASRESNDAANESIHNDHGNLLLGMGALEWLAVAGFLVVCVIVVLVS